MGKEKGDKIIGFDMDGVIVDLIKLKLQLAKQRGWNLKPEQTPSNIIKTIIPYKELSEIKDALYQDPDVSLLAPLTNGVRNTLEEINRRGTKYFLISRRRESSNAIKLLERHNLWPAYFNERNAFFVITPEDKNIKAKELGITHYIDDDVSVLEKLHDVENRFLFDSLDIFTKKRWFTKLKSWPEAVKYLYNS